MNAPQTAPLASGPQPVDDAAILNVLVAAPRGFCAGVDRAIRIVELALEQYKPPVYVRHEIVHNRYVVESLKAKGAIFVESLDQVPDGVPVVFSAHGVPKAVPAKAEARGLEYIDATCPLVSKVHRQAERANESGRHIIFIGHAGHPEVIGTLGQLPDGAITLVESIDDVANLPDYGETPLIYLTQTTLSVDDTRDMIIALQHRFPEIAGPRGEDVCYATSNRQEAVKSIVSRCDRMIVIGAPNSSNSVRLVEVAERSGIPGHLVQRGSDVDTAWLDGIDTIGVTAGASAPETLVREVINAIAAYRPIREDVVVTAEENMVFKLPRGLEAAMK